MHYRAIWLGIVMRDSKPMLFRKYHIISIIVSIIISIIMMPTVMASEKAGWAEIPANCGAARLLKHFFTDDGDEDDEVNGMVVRMIFTFSNNFCNNSSDK